MARTGGAFNETVDTVAFGDISDVNTEVAVIDKKFIGESLITVVNTTDAAVTLTFKGGDGVNHFDIGTNGAPATLPVASGASDFVLVTDPWVDVQVMIKYDSAAPTSGSVLIRHCNGAGQYDN